MQYTLRNIPARLDDALREKARAENKSLNQVAVEALMVSLGVAGRAVKQRDLGDIAGSWEADPEVDRALADQRRVDPELWR